ncbi:hypothetical protein LTR84_004127 [Exophiala bonariae]|uniref:F-box domain-containing protein n=1 Tax=Exophiala bonariae TaxID=1690606 RepID=A0AAV9N5J8_9EURO|nr:hypothetical protein LTR84_004127 [Exophiala bonariae]
MVDQPPPRKKSRFFTEGKSKIGNLLHPFRKSTAHDEANNFNQTASAGSSTLPNDTQSTHSQTASPSSSSTQALAQPSSAQSHLRRPPTASYPPYNLRSRQVNNETLRAQTRHQSSSAMSEDDTDIESNHGDEHHGEPDESDQENKSPSRASTITPALDRLAVKAPRPRAIYGVEELDPTGAHVSIFGRGQPITSTSASNPPLLQQGLETERAPFTFRADQRLTAFPPNQQSATPRGQILAQMSMQGVHQDTGPLSQSSRPLQGHPPAQGPGYIDTDRDAQGNILPVNQRYDPWVNGRRPVNLPNTGITSLPFKTTPLHLSNPDATVPDNLYTSPGRIEHAHMWAKISRKRKRPDTILPPPAYVYKRTNDPNFNILNAILLYPELVFAFASILPVKDLINLYAISRDFHTIIDTRFTTVILGQALSKARESARIFQFRCYNHMCRNDPATRMPHPNIRLAERNIPRKIPSFRWLRMILHREKVIHELMTVFAEDGIPLPARCRLALKRMWFLMDIPDNARRIGSIHNRNFMSDLDLYFAACFFTKLDMRLNDPTSGEKRDGMRKLLLGQRSLTTVLQVLKRDIWTTRYELMQEWIKFKYVPAADEAGMDIFGVPAAEIGRGHLEYWGKRGKKDLGRQPELLMRPDSLVMREALRRGFRFDVHYVRFMLYGYVRPDTLEDYAPREYGRRIEELNDEYEIDDIVGGVSALGVGDEGYDPLLDLGRPNRPSVSTAVQHPTTKEELDNRSKSKDMAALCREWWLKEMQESGRLDLDDDSDSQDDDHDEGA